MLQKNTYSSSNNKSNRKEIQSVAFFPFHFGYPCKAVACFFLFGTMKMPVVR